MSFRRLRMASFSHDRRTRGNFSGERFVSETQGSWCPARCSMESWLKDMRYALRMLVKSPAFTLIAILALGLGIGANTAIFSVFNGILWRPLPVKHPQDLVVVATKGTIGDFPFNLSYPDFLDYRELKNAFADLIAYAPSPVSLGAEGRPERAWAELVSGNYFSMLG